MRSSRFCKGIYCHALILSKFRQTNLQNNYSKFERIKNKSRMKYFNVSKKRFAKIIIPPPPLAVQQEIVKILNSFTEIEAELEVRKQQYKYYRNKLLTFKELVYQ